VTAADSAAAATAGAIVAATAAATAGAIVASADSIVGIGRARP